MATFLLSPKQHQALRYLEDDVTTELFYGGAAGGGKSVLGCYWQIKRRLKFPETRGMLGRNKLTNLKQSTLVTFFRLCKQLELQSGVHYRYNGQNKITWHNGSETILKDLFYYPRDPDFQSLGSTEYTDAFIDEGPEITEKAAEIVSSRLRWKHAEYNLTPKLLLSGNPGPHWVKNRFVKDKTGKPVKLADNQKVILALLKDNPDPEFRKRYRAQLEKALSNEYDIARLIDGDWDAEPKTGGEYYPWFDVRTHMGQVPYDPSLPVHLAWDMNKLPYMTCIAFQIIPTPDIIWVYQIAEHLFAPPFNSTEWAAKGVLKYYQDKGHTGGAIIYGDYTKKSANTGLAEGLRHEYDIIFTELRPMLSAGYDRVIPFAHPTKRRDLLNNIFLGKLPVRLLISQDCYQTKNEYVRTKQGTDGLKWKQYEVDRVTLQRYQVVGHISDASEYFFSTAFPEHLSRA